MSGIPPDHIDDMWIIAEPLIKKGTDRMPGAYCLKELKNKCLSGDLVLWVGRKAKYALLLKVSQYHLHKSCGIVAIGGDHMDEWISDLKEIEDYARSQGCKNMVISGRKGWQRVLTDYKFDSITVIKEL